MNAEAPGSPGELATVLARAQAAAAAARPHEALRRFDQVLRRAGEPPASGLEELAAAALTGKGEVLAGLGRHERALSTFGEVLERLGADGRGAAATDLRARALAGAALGSLALGRSEDALAAGEELLGLGGSTPGLAAERTLAAGLHTRALALARLGRAEEAVEGYRALVARFDAENDAELAGWVERALFDQARALEALERAEEEIEAYRQLLARCGERDDPASRELAGWARCNGALALLRLGRAEEAVAGFDAALAGAGGEKSDPTRAPSLELTSAILIGRAAAVYDLGQPEDAIAACDEALTTLARSGGRDARRASMRALFSKGLALQRLKRHDEAVVVLASGIAIHGELEPDPAQASDAEELERVVCALCDLCDSFCALGRAGEASGLGEVLAAVLGDVTAPSEGFRARRGQRTPERMAALLSHTLHGDCWLEFATGGDDEASRERMARRALDLYRRTAPWLDERTEEWDDAASAALVLRLVADGYAMLSRSTTPDRRARLPMPTRPLAETTIRRAGLEEWASELGHPLRMQEPSAAIEELLEEQRQRTGTPEWDRGFGPALASALWRYQLLALLCDSARGRSALQSPGMRTRAAWEVAEARNWAAWAGHHLGEPGAVAGIVALLAAQAWFVASRDPLGSSSALVPGRSTLRELFSWIGEEWVAERALILPDWLQEGGGDEG